ncbi:hypothetical protein MNBD_GAMMA14-2426 [hydrothermal vent metagenome]|uniref:Uncharacterized protein n=1 Tax=hydrothermal vent metagenome TaxID=652676 RepID=A0A3B0Z2F6_9ZZZZ
MQSSQSIFRDAISRSLSLIAAVLIACINLDLLVATEGHLTRIDDSILLWMKYTNMALSFAVLIPIGYFYRESADVSENTLGEMARTDPLTGLLNRRVAASDRGVYSGKIQSLTILKRKTGWKTSL